MERASPAHDEPAGELLVGIGRQPQVPGAQGHEEDDVHRIGSFTQSERQHPVIGHEQKHLTVITKQNAAM